MSKIMIRNGVPAIDVKDRYFYTGSDHDGAFDVLTEGQTRAIYEGLQLTFWEISAPEIAKAFGYGDVYSDGRSGGWLVVEGVPAFWEYDEADLTGALDDLENAIEHGTCSECLARAYRGEECVCEESTIPEDAEEIYDDAYERNELAGARNKFREFAKAVEAEIDYLRGEFTEQVKEAADKARREPELRADAAARDIMTIED